jgi:hypothetical protein
MKELWQNLSTNFSQIGEDVSTNYKDTLQQVLLMLESSSIYQTLVSKSSYHLLRIKTSRVAESGLFIIWTMTLIGFIVGFMIVYLAMYQIALFLTVFSYLGIILISLPLSLTKKLISWLVSRR